MKQQLPKQVYTDEFRAQAVLLVTRDGLSIAEAARRLSMSLKTLANWVKRAENGRPRIVCRVMLYGTSRRPSHMFQRPSVRVFDFR